MLRYLGKRFLESLISIFGITLVVFFVLHVAGDPVQLMLPASASQADVEALRQSMGFNDPVTVQFGRFFVGVIHGDFGMSYNYNEPALSVVLERVPATITLTLTSLLIALLIGIPAGILAAVKRNSKLDVIVRIFALLGQCVPAFWLGIIMMLLFAVQLKWLPTSGFTQWKALFLPAFTLGVFSAATITRQLRSSMIEVMRKEYIEVAKAKGLQNIFVILKHALKNAMSSTLTVFGLQLASLLGGSVITETVFAWPGIGRLLIQSVENSDFMVVEVIVILMATALVLINFLVDILYYVINPRVRLQ